MISVWTVEYSVADNAYKTRPWSQMIDDNHEQIECGISKDYVLIGIATNEREARKQADMHAKTLPKDLPVV